ncbi:MAG: exosortase/archaeosortase family protein [Puniceicoccaceae bacterium]
MDPSEQAATEQPGPVISRNIWILLLIAVASSWGWLLYSAHYFWSPDSYYNYGWLVAPLVGFILYRRLSRIQLKRQSELSISRIGLLFTSLAISLVLIFLFRVVIEVNPFWRIPLWLNATILLGLSMLVVSILTGWRGFLYLAFPFCFFLLALPWPLIFEVWIIQRLTELVTSITVLVINLIGYPAQGMGSTILIGDIHVGVDEACSGIRSLQALIMIAFFMGEFFSFGMIKRGILLVGSVVIALIMNGFRAIVLTLVTINGTEEQFDFWHDTLGNLNAVGGALLLFGATELITYLFGTEKTNSDKNRFLLVHTLSGKTFKVYASLFVLGFLAVELSINAYYSVREKSVNPLPVLAIDWPDNGNLAYEESVLPERSQDLLKCEYNLQADVRWSFGIEGTVVYYGYTGDDLMASLAGFGHSPLICMPSIGAQLVEEKPRLKVNVQGIPWDANHFEFAVDLPGKRKQSIQVFWLVWESRQMGVVAETMEDRRDRAWKARLAPVLSGRRDFGRQVLLVYINGDYGDDFIRRKFQELLDQITVLQEESI